MPFIQTNGIRLFYEEKGQAKNGGPPLLLIMGITAPGSVWNVHVEDWQHHFRCIIGDNRGVGQTDAPPGPYSSAQMADDYAGLLDRLNIPEAHVAGCSMGSTIAQQLAIRHPEKVRSLVLMCPWARCDTMAKGIFRHMTDCKAHLRPEQFSRYIHILIYSKHSLDKPEFAAALEEGLRSDAVNPRPQSLHGLEAQAAACMTHDAFRQLSSIRKPTLVIGGREDIFTPEWMAREVAGEIPGADLYLYEKLGHGFHFEDTPDFNVRVRNWLLEHA